MFKSFTIKNFRCFQSFKIKPLEQLNLIGGMNNVGKTSILEALFLHIGHYIPELTLNVNSLRGINQPNKVDAEAIFGWLFFDKNIDQNIEFITEDENNIERSLIIKLETGDRPNLLELDSPNITNINYSSSITAKKNYRQLTLNYQEGKEEFQNCSLLIMPDGKLQVDKKIDHLKTFYNVTLIPVMIDLSQQNAEYFSNLERHNRQDEVLQSLQLIEPKIKRISILIQGGRSIIACDIGKKELIPINLMGEGISHLLSIILAIANLPNGIVLIDEIENGLHYSTMRDIWLAIADIARRSNTQIFATTHSWDCIQAAHKAFFESDKNDFLYHRLERVNDNEIEVLTYEPEILEMAIKKGFEVR